MAQRNLLCLKCRGEGHLVSGCPSSNWLSELDWFFSPARMSMDFTAAWSSSDHSICNRCEALDILSLASRNPPWNTQSELVQGLNHGSESTLKLGKTGSIELWTDCAVCRCLFAILPNPSSLDQDIVIFPDWTMCRVSGENGVAMNVAEKRKYATCLIAILVPSSISLPLPVVAHRGDALCLMDDGFTPDATLGARKMNGTQLDIEVAERWLARCSRLHAGSECTVVRTDELQSIRLVDIKTRTVVSYPSEHCDYVALSYVWGDTPAQSYKKGDTIAKLPKTIEDAIFYTKALQKRYLWVDSLCIDQFDERDKEDQIAKMWSIYRGAYVTLIALSGESADAGLSRASRASMSSQATCCIRGQRLAGLMPTLSQQMWVAAWGWRAWTFQEALLSPRCLFISDHGLYFDCNAMQCSESLDESRSWGHNLSCSSNTTDEPFTVWMISQVGSGALRSSDSPGRKFLHWGAKTLLYSYRSMKYETDAIKAYAGVLQRLQATTYPKGFFWGMPIEDLDWALAWRSQWPPERRLGFPSWSWAGWKGGIHSGYFLDLSKHRRIPVDLEIRSCSADHKNVIFTSRCTEAGDREKSIIVLDDPVHVAGCIEPITDPVSSEHCHAAKASEYLSIDTVFSFLSELLSASKSH